MIMEDLSIWRNYHQKGDMLAVGWLGKSSVFETAEPSLEYVAKLTQLCADPVDVGRSYNTCPFCDYDPNSTDDDFYKKYGVDLGHYMIIVEGKNKIFAAPSLVTHYVARHHYKAPKEFVEAVMESASLTSS